MKKIGRSGSSGPPPPPEPPAEAAQPAPPPSGPPTSGGGTSPGGGSPSGPVKGFAASFRDAVQRKFRELTGQKWQQATEAQKRAEATRRGAREVARRIERLTGKRPAESTVRRNARRNATPKGADQDRLNRQAAIDRAGGVKPFATKAGITQRRATKWRDSGGPILPPGPEGEAGAVSVEFDVTCDIFHVGPKGKVTPDYHRRLDNNTEPLFGDDLIVEEPDASDFLAAYASEDNETLRSILGDQLAMKVVSYWPGRPGRTVTVTIIHTINVR